MTLQVIARYLDSQKKKPTSSKRKRTSDFEIEDDIGTNAEDIRNVSVERSRRSQETVLELEKNMLRKNIEKIVRDMNSEMTKASFDLNSVLFQYSWKQLKTSFDRLQEICDYDEYISVIETYRVEFPHLFPLPEASTSSSSLSPSTMFCTPPSTPSKRFR